MREQRVDPGTRDRLAKLEARLDKKYDRVTWRVTVGIAVVVVSVVLGFYGVARVLSQVSKEGHQRRDQTCLLFESQHLKDVRQLAATYRYLEGLSPRERTQGINPTVIAMLPQTEADARASAAPVYCDAPGVGLPEPNPRIPARPPGLFPPPKDAGRWAGRG